MPSNAYLTKTVAEEREVQRTAYTEEMLGEPSGSWDAYEFPPVVEGQAFGGDANVVGALKLAKKHKLNDSILAAREGVVSALLAVQFALCMAAGDSRTGVDGPKF